MSNCEVLLLGSSGMLGRQIEVCLRLNGVRYTAANRVAFDANDLVALQELINRVTPDIIVNCIAFTDVEKAETIEGNRSSYLNSIFLNELSGLAKVSGCHLIHFSTDYVFDGCKMTAYTESDVANPINEYGKAKRAGEVAIESNMENFTIIRLSWLYDAVGANLFTKIANNLLRRGTCMAVIDQKSSPVLASSLAAFVVNLIHMIDISDNKRVLCGYLHYSPIGACSVYEFASYIAEGLEIRALASRLSVKKAVAADFNSVVKRPKFSKLDNSKISTVTDFRLNHWQKDVDTSLDLFSRLKRSASDG